MGNNLLFSDRTGIHPIKGSEFINLSRHLEEKGYIEREGAK